MSADNTIAILKTPRKGGGFEYRVVHAQAIDNLWYSPEGKDYSHTGNPTEIVKYFKGVQVFTSQREAIAEAQRLYNKEYYVEYGIQEYEFQKSFYEFEKESMTLSDNSGEDNKMESSKTNKSDETMKEALSCVKEISETNLRSLAWVVYLSSRAIIETVRENKNSF